MGRFSVTVAVKPYFFSYLTLSKTAYILMHTGLETLFMIHYKIYNFGFLEGSKMNRNLFLFHVRKVPPVFLLLISGFCVGHDISSFEGVLTGGLDVFETA